MVKETRIDVQSKVVVQFFNKNFTKPFEGYTLDNLLEVEQLLNGIQSVVLKDGTKVGLRFHFDMGETLDGPH